MQRFLFVLWIGPLVLAAGCIGEGAGCLTPLGEVTTHTVALDGGFEAAQVLDRIDVEWAPKEAGEAPRLIWTAGEGVLAGMSAEVSDGTLLIQDLNTCRWVRPLHAVPKVRIEGVDCRQWLLEGQGQFTMLDTLREGDLRVTGDEMSGSVYLLFDADTLQVRMPNGIGHVDVQGRARRLRAFRSGFGDLNARQLETRQAMVHHRGLGEVHINATDYLYLEVAGAGNTYLHGTTEDSNIQILDGATGSVMDVP